MSDRVLKVLVVDDEEGILDLTQRILRFKCGYETFGTGDGQEALRLFLTHKPDICILDVHLDVSALNGIDILKKVKAMNPRVQCIMMTRITDARTIAQAKEFGAAAYLLKPLDAKEWVEVVKEVAEDILEKER